MTKSYHRSQWHRAANLAALLVITPTGPADRRPDGVRAMFME